MSLRTFNAILLAILLVGCALLWSRELGLRADFAAETRRQADLRSALNDEKLRANGLREDIAELRGQLELTRSQRSDIQAQLRSQQIELGRRTAEWQSALRLWETAVHERDRRIGELTEREMILVDRLSAASETAQAATKRLLQLESTSEKTEAK